MIYNIYNTLDIWYTLIIDLQLYLQLLDIHYMLRFAHWSSLFIYVFIVFSFGLFWSAQRPPLAASSSRQMTRMWWRDGCAMVQMSGNEIPPATFRCMWHPKKLQLGNQKIFESLESCRIKHEDNLTWSWLVGAFKCTPHVHRVFATCSQLPRHIFCLRSAVTLQESGEMPA